MKLPKRLRAVLEAIPQADTIADIGTDHGYLAVAMIQTGTARRVVAGDIHEGPWRTAKNYVQKMNMEEVISCRLGNGLAVLEENEADGAVICGMGGLEMIDIIESAPSPLSFFVLQPQRNQGDLRKFLLTKQYIPVYEGLVEDMGRIYEYMVVCYGGDNESFVAGVSLSKRREIQAQLQALPDDSLLWEVGPLIDRSHFLYEKHLNRLIGRRKKVLANLVNKAIPDRKEIFRLEKECSILEGYR